MTDFYVVKIYVVTRYACSVIIARIIYSKKERHLIRNLILAGLLLVSMMFPFAILAQTTGGTLGRGTILDFAMSQKGEFIAVSSATGVWVYDGNSLADIAHTCTKFHNADASNMLEWSPDASQLACLSTNELVVWNATENSEQSYLTLPENEAKIWVDVDWHPNNSQFAVTDESQIIILDTHNDSEVLRFQPDLQRNEAIHSVYFGESGERLTVLTSANVLRSYDLQSGEQVQLRFTVDSETLEILEHPGRSQFAMVTDDGIRIWNPDELNEAQPAHISLASQVRWSADGSAIAASVFLSRQGIFRTRLGNTLQVYDVEAGRLLLSTEFPVEPPAYYTGEGIFDFAISPDGKTAIVYFGNPVSHQSWHPFRKIDIETGEQTPIFGELFGTFLAWHPNGEQVIMVSDSGTLQLRDVATEQIVAERFEHFYWVTKMAWSPDDSQLAIHAARRDFDWHVWSGGHVQIWKDATLQAVIPENKVVSLAWLDDNHIVTATEFPCSIRLWDAQSGEQVPLNDNMIEWDVDRCTNVTLSPNGNIWAISTLKLLEPRVFERGIQLYHINIGQVIANRLLEDDWRVQYFRWSDDGQQVVVRIAKERDDKDITLNGTDLSLIHESEPFVVYDYYQADVPQTEEINHARTLKATILENGVLDIH